MGQNQRKSIRRERMGFLSLYFLSSWLWSLGPVALKTFIFVFFNLFIPIVFLILTNALSVSVSLTLSSPDSFLFPVFLSDIHDEDDSCISISLNLLLSWKGCEISRNEEKEKKEKQSHAVLSQHLNPSFSWITWYMPSWKNQLYILQTHTFFARVKEVHLFFE